MTARPDTASQGRLTLGIILILIGLFQFLTLLAHGTAWPVVLILLGGFLLWQATGGFTSPRLAADDGTVSDTTIFGHIKRTAPAAPFRGGSVTSVLGNVELDLRQATFGPDPVRLDVVSVLGAVDLKVPAGCTVDVRVSPVMGGVENKTQAPAANPRLIVYGCAVLGALVVSN